MIWPVLAGAVSSAADKALSGAGVPPPGATPDNLRNNINVSPVGFNLGSIMHQYTDNPANGGYGLQTDRLNFSGLNTAVAPEPWTANTVTEAKAAIKSASSGSAIPLAIGGAILLVAVAAFAGR